jgi:hypothetical protein
MHFVTGPLVTVLSFAARTFWFFIAALVGPIAEANCGIAITTALIATSRRTVWRAMFMWHPSQNGRTAGASVFNTFVINEELMRRLYGG